MRPIIPTSLFALTTTLGSPACSLDGGRGLDDYDRSDMPCGDGGAHEATCIEPKAGDFAAIPLGESFAGAFEVSWTLTPTTGTRPGGAGLSQGEGETFDELGPIVRFAVGGQFDARDGDAYRADAVVDWVHEEIYEVRMVVDVESHVYDVFLTDPDGQETQLADDYAFRSTQADVLALDHLSIWSGTSGTMQACGATAMVLDETGGGETGGGEADDGYILVPSVTGSLRAASASVGSIESTIAAAQPGDRVTIPSGTFDDVDFDFVNGRTDDDPIVVVPADPSDPPLFTGRNEATGDHFMLMGLRFDAEGTGGGGRMLKLQNTDASTLAYLEFTKTDNIALELAGGVTNVVVHRSLFEGTGEKTGNGGEAIKCGVSNTGAVQRGNRIEKSRFEDIVDERETISGKEGGLTLFQLTFENTTDIVARQATNMLVEECTGVRRITLNGPDHRVFNSQAEDIEIWSGSYDGSMSYDSIPSGSSSVYLSGHDIVVEHSSGSLRIGEDSFAGGDFVADGTQVANHASTPMTFNGATFDEVPAQSEARTPLVIDAVDTGLSAYVEFAIDG